MTWYTFFFTRLFRFIVCLRFAFRNISLPSLRCSRLLITPLFHYILVYTVRWPSFIAWCRLFVVCLLRTTSSCWILQATLVPRERTVRRTKWLRRSIRTRLIRLIRRRPREAPRGGIRTDRRAPRAPLPPPPHLWPTGRRAPRPSRPPLTHSNRAMVRSTERRIFSSIDADRFVS